MTRFIGFRVPAALALACVAGVASAQPPAVLQVLKDVWVATATNLYDVDFDDPTASKEPITGYAVGSGARALAFEPPQLGSGGAVRSLIAVDGAKLLRFADGSTTPLLDAGSAPTSMTLVNAVAVADDGTVLFSGFSRPKRVYELWALNPVNKALKLQATGTPQLLDAVYVNAEDAAAAGFPGEDGGLLAVAAKAVMFFPEPAAGWMSTTSPLNNPDPLLDAALLGLKGSVQLLSADLVRKTELLMLATSDRKLLTTLVSGASLPTPFGPIAPPCNIKTQRLLVRNARGGPDATSVVSDICGQVVRYDFTTTSTSVIAQALPQAIGYSTGVVAIAVGEGNAVSCLAGESCTLTNGFEATIPVDEELLVRQYANLCDPRVLGCDATGEVSAANVLTFNSLLPQGIQDALKFDPLDPTDDVIITIPPYMFAAGPNGRFGALIVQTDDAGAAAKATVDLDIYELLGFELGTRSIGTTDGSFVRGEYDGDETPGEEDDAATDIAEMTLALLNQDIVAYAPDNPDFGTVRGFEATPVTTGSYNPLVGGLRGFSVVFFGLQHDLYALVDRSRIDPAGGLPSLEDGSPPRCDLSAGGQQFIAKDAPERFFINLAACLMTDQETLLTASSGIIPAGALSAADRSSLLSRLANVKDKLIKALNATGPNTGSTDFQAVMSQVALYDAAVLATPFNQFFNVYKNELVVRSDAFKFILTERAYPSLPTGGFPPADGF